MADIRVRSEVAGIVARIAAAVGGRVAEGDEIIIMGFELTDKPVESKQIMVGKHNEFLRYLSETPHTCLSELVGQY